MGKADPLVNGLGEKVLDVRDFLGRKYNQREIGRGDEEERSCSRQSKPRLACQELARWMSRAPKTGSSK